MKLTDLEPLLDPRRPLRFATEPAGHGRVTATRPRHLVAVRPLADRSAADRPVHATSEAVPSLPVAGALRARAADAVRMFSGAATGLLAALWIQEAPTLEAQLQATTDAPGTFDALAGFDALHRAFGARDVRALSPQVAAGFAARPLTAARLADGLSRRSSWGDGVLWSPARHGLVAWSTDGAGTRLVLVDGADLATWVTRLADDTPPVLRWSSLFLPAPDAAVADQPATDTDLPVPDGLGEVWRPVVTEIVRLAALGYVGGPSRAPIADGDTPPVPVTRLLMTAAEARVGIVPTDLTTGGPPIGAPGADWLPARYRETWSAAQGRRIRVFADATPAGRRPPIEPVLVTVLPH